MVERIGDNAVTAKGCSVLLVIAGIVLLPILITGTSTTSLLTSTCDHELTSTRDQNEVEILNCFNASKEQAFSQSADVLKQEGDEVNIILDFLSQDQVDNTNRLSNYVFKGNMSRVVTLDYLMSLLPDIFQIVYAANDTGLQVASVYTGRQAVLIIDYQVPYPTSQYVTAYSDPTNVNQSYLGNTVPFTSSVEQEIHFLDNLYDAIVKDDIDTGRWDSGEPRWSRLKLYKTNGAHLTSVGIDLMMLHNDVLVAVNYLTTDLGDYLVRRAAEIQRRSGDGTFETRIFIVVADDTWGQRNNLVATSHGEAIVVLPNGDDAMQADINCTDELVSSIATSIHASGGYESVSQYEAATLDVHWNGTAMQHLVYVGEWRHKYELSWWVVVSIDLGYVVKVIKDQHTSTQAETLKSRKEVDDKIAKDRRTSIIMVAGIALAMMIIAAAITAFLLKPVSEIQSQMSQVAEMDLEGVEVTSRSFVREVRLMQISFLKMIANLREYRTYVPASVLENEDRTEVPPPTGNIALVFTDIEGSTALWNKNGAAMNAVMETHNQVIRKAYKTYGGYEVKTIGDAFMIAFVGIEAAVECCMEIIEQLALQEWPAELELPETGLQVRLGCHAGNVLAEHNPLTSRIDYRGNTVNLASRVEGKARGGTLCITDEVKQMLPSSSRYNVVSYGTHEIKGLGPGYVLHLVEPANITYRTEKDKKKEKDRYLTHPSNASAMTGGSSEIPSKSSSGGGASSCGDKAVHINNRKTGLSLTTSMGTVAVCRLNRCEDKKVFEACNTMVRAATEMAFTTDGTLGSVTGDTLTVLWNCGKPCTLHIMSALRFAADLDRRIGKSVMHVGVATGKLMHGNVGTRTTRFNTVFGLPLEIAEVALEYAMHLEAFCVVADASSHHLIAHDHTLKSFVRPVDVWQLKENREKISVYYFHLLSQVLNSILESWDTASTDPPASIHTFSMCMNEILSGHPTNSALTTIKTLAATAPEDVVLNKIVQMVTDGGSWDPTTRVATLSRLPSFITN
eukprot:TRINITY_DN12013_c0_g1_i1.p1 TRINITY_DN12013_c0_g1~~TRINITY_DN12013_c0_g1_i1.p1  ORF type:complete len:1041 (+),score=333.58 TRINITY_DN12013_c0_g1_i1:72-3125(+)